MDDSGSYAPESPDLTAFYSSNTQQNPSPSQHYQSFSANSATTPQAYTPIEHQQNAHYYPPQESRPLAKRAWRPEGHRDDEWTPGQTGQHDGNSSAHQQQPGDESNGGQTSGGGNGIDVKTKFPVARIKRIMQADDDVGKVAQVTPVAVCKYLVLLSHVILITYNFGAHRLMKVRLEPRNSKSAGAIHDISRHQSRHRS